MQYLFNKWDTLKEELKDRYLFIFLDFDGTITPIVDTPEKAILPEATKRLLDDISRNPRLKLAFISGRTLKDIKERVGLKNAIYSGNHGLELEGPKIKHEPIVSLRYKDILERIKDDLTQKLSPIKGALVEDKGLSLSIHYRLVAKEKVPFVKTAFHEAIILYLVRGKIKIKFGKKVLEVRPPDESDKGKMVLWLLTRQIFAANNESVYPVYIGDDVTDEDAFKALKDKGLTLFVGKPKKSYARYYVKNSNEVVKFLDEVAKLWKKL